MTTAVLAQAAPSTRVSPAVGAAGSKRRVLTEFTREQVESALIAAGKTANSTDADIRRLTNVQFHMVKYGLNTIETEAIDDELTSKLLDFFCTVR